MSKSDISHLRHSHSFGQESRRDGESRTIVVIALTSTMMLVEVSAGIIFGSMALLADGMHMASHTVALGIAAFAYYYARRHANDARFSFGTGKVNALGGFTGAILLAVFALMMAWESIERLVFPTEIAFNAAIAVAVLGLIVNAASVFILGNHDHHDHHGDTDDHHHHTGHIHDHNLRSAYLHVLADALTSVTAIIALITAKYLEWIWMDPLMGIVGSLLVAYWSFGLIRQTSRLLLDHQASNEIVEPVRQAIRQHEEVQIVDLHVWSVGPGIYSVIITLATDKLKVADKIKKVLNPEIYPHVTVEVHSTTDSATDDI